ncbi:hypothetical protein WKH02_03975 [Pantoea agglomerans]|uniref:hypothetical protein n=1 Tax=Enterobacter agglomerans TaxID=549 RepID=UPI003C7B9FB9
MNQSSVKGNKVFGLAIQGVNGKAGLPDTSVTRPSASQLRCAPPAHSHRSVLKYVRMASTARNQNGK